MINWQCKSFGELTNGELYKVLQLRMEVFVVEQNCVFQDCDDKDQRSFHLCGWQREKLAAYTRLVPPGLIYTEASIGRVITAQFVRGTQTGRELMKHSIDKVFELFNTRTIKIGAQLYLQKFYESFGFVICSGVYLEDGIEHIKMKLN